MGPTMITGASRHHVALGWVRHDEALTKMAAACWARDRFTDVTIFCEDRPLHAHRLVLASMSPLLANLLGEAEGPDTALMLPEVKAEDMRLLLQFIYQGEVVLPPRRTASLLDLAALLCVAGVRGGAGAVPPSPPRSDSPGLDSCDRTHESDPSVVSEDEQQHHSSSKRAPTPQHEQGDGSSSDDKHIDVDNDTSAEEENDDDDQGHESNDDTPMNLAAKPEFKSSGTVACARPKPCSSSPPDFNVSPTHQTTPRSTPTPTPTTCINRSSFDLTTHRFADNYYQHPALQGCHPFSLELAGRGCRTPEPKWSSSRNQFGSSSTADNLSDSDVEVTVDIGVDGDSDREIDLSLKTDLNRLPLNSIDEDKSMPTSELDTSFGSSESSEQLKVSGRGVGGGGEGLYLHPKGVNGVLSGHSSLADKLLLLPSGGGGGSADPRRTYLEAVLQDSLVQQSYTIVLPSQLGVNGQLPMDCNSKADAGHLAAAMHAATPLDSNLSKAWNLSEKSSAAAAVAELHCLQGLFGSRASAAGHAAALQCPDDDDDDDDMMPTNLSKNGHCSSSSSLNAKRNGKEGYSCQVCRKVFTSSSNLAVHSMIHSGTKPFKCDLCSWSFRQKAHLQKHMRHIHKVIVAK